MLFGLRRIRACKTNSMIELSFSLLIPMISDAAVTTIQKIGLERRSVMFDDVMDNDSGRSGHTVPTIANGDLGSTV